MINVTLHGSKEGDRPQFQPGGQLYFLLARWAPSEDRLVLVEENDVYYRPDPRENRDFRVTTDGVVDVFYNGIADWVYEGIPLGFTSLSASLLPKFFLLRGLYIDSS